MIICLAREADDQAAGISDIEALALTLGGCVELETVSANITALRITLSPDVAPRFIAAMALVGAASIKTTARAATQDLIVLVMQEAKTSDWSEE